MQAENSPQKKNIHPGKKKTKRRILFWLLSALFVLILLVTLFLPAFISSEKGNKIILAKINSFIDGTVDFSSLKMSWRQGIDIKELKFSDSTGQILLSVRQIHTKPHYLSLLTQAPAFGQTTIDEPYVNINIRNASAEKTEALPQRPAGRKKATPPVKKIALTINDGSLKVTDSMGQMTELSRINCSVNLNPPPQQTSFEVSLIVPDETRPSKITAAGRISPAITKTGFNLAKSTGNFTAQIDELLLDKLNPLAVYLGLIDRNTKMNGSLSSDISVKTEDNICEISTQQTQISNLKIHRPNRKSFEQEQISLNLQAELNALEQSVIVKTLQLLSPQIKIRSNSLSYATKDNKIRLQGEIDYEYDWQTICSFAASYLPEELQIEGKRKDSIIFSSQYPADKPAQLLASLNASTKFGFDKAEVSGLHLAAAETGIKIENGLLKIEPFSITANKGRLNLAVHADLKTKPIILETPSPIQIVDNIQLNDEVAVKLLPYLNPIFANAADVTGKANLYCEKLVIPLAAGRQNEIEIAATFSVDNLRMQASNLLGQVLQLTGQRLPGQSFTIRPTKFTLKNGLISYDDMQVDIGDNPLNFKGTIGLNKSLDMIVILPYTLKGATVRVDKKTVGERIELPIKGTIDNPQLDMKKMLDSQLQNLIDETLQDLLEHNLQKILKEKL